MVKGQLHGMHSGTQAPVKNRLVPVIVQVKSAWCVDSECNFMKFVVGCFVPRALPYGSNVFVCVRSKIRGWGETRLHGGSGALLAALSARSLPGMPTWPGSQQR